MGAQILLFSPLPHIEIFPVFDYNKMIYVLSPLFEKRG